MSKVLVMVRVSTEGQDTTDQKNEMLDFVQHQGYQEKDIVWIVEKGASAIKLNDKYLEMIDQIKECIRKDRDIDCLSLWHLNRGFRTEIVFYQLKEFLVTNKIQLLIKNPYLKLLNDDKSVNAGTELALSLLMTLAQQDMLEKKAKFARAKKSNSEQHKFNGGFSVKYGYRIDKDGYVVPDEQDSKVVREIFELYATGLYSSRTLAYELQDRGIEPSRNSLLTPEHEACRKAWTFQPDTVMKILQDTAYIGWSDNDYNHSHRKYIPIISQELWDKVKVIREKNFKYLPRTNKVRLGLKIVKCPECGNPLFCDGTHYACWRSRKRHIQRNQGECDYSMALHINVTDSYVWTVAYQCEMNDSKLQTKEKQKEVRNTMKVIAQKQHLLKMKLEQQDDKKKRIVDAYLDDLITKAERDKRLKSLAESMTEYQLQINRYEEQLDSIRKGPQIEHLSLPDTLSLITDNEDLKTAQKVARKHIKSCTAVLKSVGDRDPRSKKPNAVFYTIETYTYGTFYYLYFPKGYKKVKRFISNENAEMVEPI